MKKQILEYLNGFQDHEYHEINNFLKQDFAGNEILTDIRTALTELMSEKLINVENAKHSRLGLPFSKFHAEMSIINDLDNLPIRAKILERGREQVMELKAKILSTKKAVYDTEISKRQYEDYPMVKRRATIALIVSIAAVVIALLKLIFG